MQGAKSQEYKEQTEKTPQNIVDVKISTPITEPQQ